MWLTVKVSSRISHHHHLQNKALSCVTLDSTWFTNRFLYPLSFEHVATFRFRAMWKKAGLTLTQMFRWLFEQQTVTVCMHWQFKAEVWTGFHAFGGGFPLSSLYPFVKFGSGGCGEGGMKWEGYVYNCEPTVAAIHIVMPVYSCGMFHAWLQCLLLEWLPAYACRCCSLPDCLVAFDNIVSLVPDEEQQRCAELEEAGMQFWAKVVELWKNLLVL